MGRIYYAELKAVSVTGVTAQDVWSVTAAAGEKVRLYGWHLTSNATAAAIIDCNLHKITATGSGGGTYTAEQVDEIDAASTAVIGKLDTTAGADGGGGEGYQWEQLGPLQHIYIPEMRWVSNTAQGFAFTWNTATAATVSGWFCWEEL